jgi:UDP-glucuronate 4-epimerase
MENSPKILITGSAGFIGFHLSELLLKSGFFVIGLDQINDYYDINLKYARLLELGISKNRIKEKELVSSDKYNNYNFIKANLEDYEFIVCFLKEQAFDFVVNLAAQAGVRYSLQNPRAYTKSNVDGFLSILEGCRQSYVKHLIYASTSSVYGLNTQMPLNEDQPTEHPVSLYAATKKANEMMAHCYSHLYGLPTTGLRFFTVYGPWGRPDMALFLFTRAIVNGEPINVFNDGQMIRDFTYVADIVESIKLLIPKAPMGDVLWNGDTPRISTSKAPYRIFNIGNSSPVKLLDYIFEIESQLKIRAKKNYMELQPGDVISTYADTASLSDYIKFKPATPIRLGIENFIKWYKIYYKIKK